MELDEFLKKNNIKWDDLYEAIHLDIRETILKVVCGKLKKDYSFFLWAKKIFFKYDDITATQKVVNHSCECFLTENDTLWMCECLKAFFSKSSVRLTISEDLKYSLLSSQENKCAICRCDINKQNMHVDHIIPWDFVGDKLPNNYQALCEDCNLSKSNNVARTVINLIRYRRK